MAKLLTLLNILIMPKDYSVELNEYLHTDEIKCKCSRKQCHFTLVAQETIDSFYRSRLAVGLPLKVNSWFRCQEHNKAVGGIDESSHTTGLAVDVRKFYEPANNKKLKKALEANFDVVIEYYTFFHCHNEPDQVKGGICA